jgi:uncharacterized protein YyaL (SSP411 family)
MLIALDFYLGPTVELAIVGDPENAESRRVLRAIFGKFRPNKVVALRSAEDAAQPTGGSLKLLEGKSARGNVTTYICENLSCQAPLVGPEAAESALAKTEGPS